MFNMSSLGTLGLKYTNKEQMKKLEMYQQPVYWCCLYRQLETRAHAKRST